MGTQMEFPKYGWRLSLVARFRVLPDGTDYSGRDTVSGREQTIGLFSLDGTVSHVVVSFDWIGFSLRGSRGRHLRTGKSRNEQCLIDTKP